MNDGKENIQEIAGYHLAGQIGSGGMGNVYKAYNASLNRVAAVKILYRKEMGERFKNEAYIQSSVSHPNIACLYEYVLSGNTPCIIMEYVEGESLDMYLHKKGKLSNEETERVVMQIASALAYLHKKDIIHRDIKPQNFKVQPDGKVTMLDFGIAKNKYTPKLTQQGFIVGTTEYMAPEQFRQQVDQRSDIWSLGVLTYELLTGYLPFEANNQISLRSKIEKAGYTDPTLLVSNVSKKLELLIDKSLLVNPSQRISAAAIETLLGGKKNEAVKKKNTVPFSFVLNNKTRKGLMLAAVLVSLLFIVFALAKNTGNEERGKNTEQTAVPVIPGNNELLPLKINVTNIENASLVLPDGTRQVLPYELQGKEGETFELTLQADGYEDKKVQVEINHRRRSYEYNLEKIK